MTLTAGVPALAACGSGGDERLVVYSGRTSNLIDPLLNDFADDSGISVTVRYGESADLALLIDEEGDRTLADVFISQSPGAVGFLDAAGRLAPLADELIAAVPEGDAAADAGWVGLSGRVRTLVYNPDLVDDADLPDSVLDLTAPEYAGRVALAPTNGSFQDFVTVLRDQL
ncbi:MAG: extracellular solute-binding protein, partial [Acidimicrobiales bacterium]